MVFGRHGGGIFLGAGFVSVRGIENFKIAFTQRRRLLHKCCQLRKVVEWLRSLVEFLMGAISGHVIIHCFFIHCGVYGTTNCPEE